MQKPTLIAKTALLNERGEVLILTRSDTDTRRPGGYDLPGGGVDEGENYEAAAAREIKEEIGVDISPADLSLVFSETSYYEGETAIRFLFVAMLKQDSPITLSYEHSNSAWMGRQRIIEEYSHPVWIKAIQYASEHDLLPVPLAS